jgi:2-methylcitrate dehydratase PrpD
VAGALALGTDPVVAAGHAISVAGGSILALLERRSQTWVVHRDHAVGAALRCAQLTELRATGEGLEHPQGLFAAMGGSPERLLEPFEEGAIAGTSLRAHATSGFNQALVEAARDLDDDGGPILVEAPAATLALAGDPPPGTAEDAWWSAPHAVAATLSRRDREDLAHVTDPEVAEVRARIELREAEVSRVTVGGRSAQRTLAAPMTDDDLIAKWRTLNPSVAPPLDLLEEATA